MTEAGTDKDENRLEIKRRLEIKPSVIAISLHSNLNDKETKEMASEKINKAK